VITRRGMPNAVVLAEDEYRSLMETVYLLRTPANARRLFDAIERSERGEGIEMTIEELRAMVEQGIAEAKGVAG
jgi:antitoxin YefM